MLDVTYTSQNILVKVIPVSNNLIQTFLREHLIIYSRQAHSLCMNCKLMYQSTIISRGFYGDISTQEMKGTLCCRTSLGRL